MARDSSFNPGPINFLILHNNPFCHTHRKEPVNLKCRMGLLGKSLIISEQFHRVVKCCVEIKCPSILFLEMHGLTRKIKRDCM